MNKLLLGLGIAIMVLGGCLADPAVETETVSDSLVMVSSLDDIPDDVWMDEGGDGFLAPAPAAQKCNAPKVQICHLPGGDLSKANTLCISASAVDTHQFHHGDYTGPCAPPAPVCSSTGGVCTADSSCCTGFCSGGACRTTCQVRGGACDSASDCCTGMACTSGACVAQI